MPDTDTLLPAFVFNTSWIESTGGVKKFWTISLL